ncbi:MAG TPA: protein-glutamine glutaminase family protein [Chitinophagaceae bacterium]|nr:protein-glutamine glutaminase family protein [Chitinophagaceae bacterium]
MIKKTLYDHILSDEIKTDKAISKLQAEKLFTYFKDHPLFRWQDANNDCEDRANAICILLDEWKIQNGKGWVFSGYVFKKIGFLKNLWKYHVAALLPVKEGDETNYYIIDPATSGKLIIIEEWAANVTDSPHSYYLIKNGDDYIFHPRKIEKNNWYKRNKGNYNWTIQGLSGINGVSSKGKAQLAFNKKNLLKTKKKFKELLNSQNPL